MANNNFKVDLSGMVREIQDMNRAMEQLGQIAQGVFNNLGRAADMFGSKMNQQGIPGKSGGSIVMPGQEQMLTARGQQAMSEASERSAAAVRLQQKMTNNPQGYMINAEDQIMRKSTSAQGTLYHYTGFDKQTLQQSIAAAQQSSAFAQSAQGFSAGNTPRSIDDFKLARGYNQKDLPRILGMSEDAAKLASNLGGIAGSTTNTNVQGALNSVKSDLLRQNEMFIANLSKYNSAGPGTDDQKKAFAELTKAMRDLEDAVDNANSISKDAARFGGGGGSGGSGGIGGQIAEFFQKNRRGIGAVTDLAVAGVSAYLAVDVATKRATYGKQMERDEAVANLASGSFQNLMASHDMSKAENLLRYRGDMITPGAFNYLGKGGLDRAMDSSRAMEKDKIDLLKSERNQALWSGFGQAVTGVGTGLALGSISGGLGLAAGVGGIIAGVGTMANAYYGSEYTAISGGLDGIKGGPMAQRAALAKLKAEEFSNAQKFQELELQMNPQKVMGTQEYLDRARAQNRAAALVGGYAMSGNSSSRVTLNDSEQKTLDDSIRASDAIKESLAKDRFATIPTPLLARSALLYAVDRNISTRSSSDRWVGEQNIKDNLERKIIGIDDSIERQEARYSRRGPDSYATSLGMSESEFMISNAEMINAMGFKNSDNQAQTSGLLRMSKGGMGDFGQLLGNLTSLNKSSGGNDNYDQLRRIMAAGVSAGFDTSRVAMQFVQTTSELSRSLGITSADSLAKGLSFGATALSQTGKADERTLGLAAKGMSDLAAYTSDASGTTGALKLMGIYGAGGRLGQGGGILSASSSEELLQFQKELMGSGKLSDKAADVVRLLGGDTPENRKSALGQVTGALQGSTVGLRGVVEGNFAANTALQKKYGVTSVNELMMKSRGFVGKQKDDFMRDLTAITADAAQSNDLPRELGQGLGSFMMRSESGYTSEADMNKMNKLIAEGLKKSINPADIEMKRFVSQMYKETTFESSKRAVSMGEYKNYLKSGGQASLSAMMGDTETPITSASIAKAEGDALTGDKNAQAFLKDAEKEIAKMSRFDLATQAAAQADAVAQSGASKVYVTNLLEIQQYMRPLTGRDEFNK
jgi:hypothetical protein